MSASPAFFADTASLLDALPLGVLALSPEGAVLDLNQRAAAWWGLAQAQARGRQLAELPAGQLPAALYVALQQLAAAADLPPQTFYLPAHQQYLTQTSAWHHGQRLVYWQETTTPPPPAPSAEAPVLNQYQTLLQGMEQAFCRLEVLFDDQGAAVDCRFLESNPAFERQTRFGNPVGRTMLEMGPAYAPPWAQRYGAVVRAGQSVHFEQESTAGGTWYDIFALPVGPPESHQVAVLFTDVTVRKRHERNLACLADITSDLNRLAHEAELVQAAGTRLGTHLRLDACYFLTINEAADHAQLLNSWRRPELPLPQGEYRISDFIPPAIAHTLRAGQAVIEADIRHALAAEPASYQAISVGALVAVPFHRGGAWRHLLAATAGTSRAWRPDEVELLREVTQRLFTHLGRARAKEALRESEARFRAVANLVPDLLWRSDARGYTSWLNHRWLAYTGQSLADSTGFGWLKAVHTDDHAEVLTNFQLAAQEQRLFRQEHRIRSSTGEDRWFLVQALPVASPDGSPTEWLGSATDIHERRQAEQQLRQFAQALEQQVAERTQALQESNNLLNAIAKTQTVVLNAFRAVRDERGRIVDLEYIFSNAQADEPAGGPGMVGGRYLARFPEAERAGFLASYRRVIETGAMEDQELLYTDAHHTSWFRSIATKLGDGVLVSSEDITARKQAEQERANTLRLLAQTEVVAGLGNWSYDVATGRFAWSEGMYRLFGLPLGTPVTPHIYLQFVVPDDQPIVERLLQKLVDSPTDFEKTIRIRVADRIKTLRIKAVVTYHAQGQPAQVLGVDLDLSELKRLEAENLHMRLHQQQERIAAVLEAQEEERRRLAESLHNGLGQLLYATKLQLDQLATAQQLAATPLLATARSEATRLLSEAIRQARTISHELMPGSVAEFGLATALRDICRSLSGPHLHWQCLIYLDEEEPLPLPLQVAVYRLAQEVAQNVIKHARAHHATLEVETLPGWLVLRAEDDGQGFEPAAPTSGIGLKTLRHRVVLLGGTVHLSSVVGQGTHLQIRIPLPAVAA